MYKWLIVIITAFVYTSVAQTNNSTLTKKYTKSFFIIKKNKVYGIGDSAQWYANSPLGDTAYYLDDNRFAFRDTNNQYCIYNDSFKLVHKNLIAIEKFGEFLILQNSLGYKIVSESNNQETKYYDSIRVYNDYAWLYKKGKQGIFCKNWKFKKIIEPMYDKVGTYYNGILLINNGRLGWEGSVTIPIEFGHIYKERNDIMAASNNRGTIYFALSNKSKLLIEPTDSVVFYDEFYKRVRGKNQSIFKIKNNELFAETNDYEIHPFSFTNNSYESSHCIATKDSLCALFQNGKLLTGFNYDNFLQISSIEPPFYKVMKQNKTGVIDDKEEILLKPLYTDVIENRLNYFIVRVGNRLALVLKGDSIILPASYQSIHFINDKYVFVSFDGTNFGIYNYITQKEITPCKYTNFSTDSVFILAKKGAKCDVYFRETIKFIDLYDAQSNAITAKGYRDGKVYVGSLRKNEWEEFNYEIPSYKVDDDGEYKDKSYLHPFIYDDKENIYDYSVGKWGIYSYRNQKWYHKPLIHSGDETSGHWLLGKYRDTTITWKGIKFNSTKSVSPIDIAWNKNSYVHWMDINSYSYTSDNFEGYNYTVSPISYTEPGKGICYGDYKKTVINALFRLNGSHTILCDEGKIEITNAGEISLSDYISQLSSNGTIHLASIADYETVINPNLQIKITGAQEHVLHTKNNREKHISAFSSFDWFDKKENSVLVFRKNNKYGVLSDSSSYILKPEYESIETLEGSNNSILKVGVRADGYKIYDPITNAFSKLITPVVEKKRRNVINST
jgi:hypothetical protein